MNLHDITMKEFKAGLKKTKTLIIPYGSVEAHGTHLPLSTDTIAIVEALKEATRSVEVFVAPPLHYGYCSSTGDHPGTLNITPETLRRISIDLVRDGASKGMKNFILISGHGGSIHTFAIKEAADRLVSEIKGIKIAALRVYEVLGKDAEKIAETPGDAHAGEIETSLMLHLYPELVKGVSPKGKPKLPKHFYVGDRLKQWPGAVNGDPSKATREKGEAYFNEMVRGIVGLVKEMEGLK